MLAVALRGVNWPCPKTDDLQRTCRRGGFYLSRAACETFAGTDNETVRTARNREFAAKNMSRQERQRLREEKRAGPRLTVFLFIPFIRDSI